MKSSTTWEMTYPLLGRLSFLWCNILNYGKIRYFMGFSSLYILFSQDFVKRSSLIALIPYTWMTMRNAWKNTTRTKDFTRNRHIYLSDFVKWWMHSKFQMRMYVCTHNLNIYLNRLQNLKQDGCYTEIARGDW